MLAILPIVIIDGIALGFLYAIIALGYTMVYGVLEFINFAHGEIFMVGAFVGGEFALFLAGRGLLGSIPPLLFVLMAVILGMARERTAGHGHRADCLSAATQRSTPGAADLGDRRITGVAGWRALHRRLVRTLLLNLS